MSLSIEINGDKSDYRIAVKLVGSLDTATAGELETALEPYLASEDVHVFTFDLEELDFLSSAGVRVFIATRKKLKERYDDASVIFSQLQPQISKVFEIVRALDGVNVFTNTEELDCYLAKIQEQYRQ